MLDDENTKKPGCKHTYTSIEAALSGWVAGNRINDVRIIG